LPLFADLSLEKVADGKAWEEIDPEVRRPAWAVISYFRGQTI
jgi:hypothetical protein